jgi:hypothetical protein
VTLALVTAFIALSVAVPVGDAHRGLPYRTVM